MMRRRAEEEKPEVVEESAAEAEDELKENGVYYVWGSIGQGTLKPIHQDPMVKRLSGWTGSLQILINSDGGDLNETYALIDLMKVLPYEVSTVGFGTCASAAAMLLAAGTKGQRICAPSTAVMVHQYAWGVSGKHGDLVAHRKPQDDSYDQMLKFWMAHSKYKTRKQVEKHLLRAEDVWLTAEEALFHGIVDKISG